MNVVDIIAYYTHCLCTVLMVFHSQFDVFYGDNYISVWTAAQIWLSLAVVVRNVQGMLSLFTVVGVMVCAVVLDLHLLSGRCQCFMKVFVFVFFVDLSTSIDDVAVVCRCRCPVPLAFNCCWTNLRQIEQERVVEHDWCKGFCVHYLPRT